MTMTPDERLAAAAIIIRDSIEDLLTERELEKAERNQEQAARS